MNTLRIDRRSLIKCACLGIISTVIGSGAPVAKAEEADMAQSTESPSVDFVFDLTNHCNQSQEITLEDGTVARIEIEYISPVDDIAPCGDWYYNNASGVWRIYYPSPLIEREFYVNIVNNTIKTAWGQSYTSFLCTVTSANLYFVGARAVYDIGFNYIGDLGSKSVTLWAQMEGTTLHTHAD